MAHKDSDWTSFFQRTDGWVAGDGAMSVALADDRVLWLFGDSHVNDFDAKTGTLPALFQVRNAAFIHDKNTPTQKATRLLNTPANRNLFRHPDGGKLWFWPQAGFQNSDAVYVYLIALEPSGKSGNFDFKAAARYWAKMPLPHLTPIEYTRLPDSNGIDFGCGFVRDDATREILAFGQKANGLGSSVYVARFPAPRPDHNWKFWNGTNWEDDAANATPVMRSPTVSVTACKLKHKFVLTSAALSLRCDMGKDIFVSTSSSPTGPFSPCKIIYTLDDMVQGHSPFFYMPVLHPEFINSDNEVLLTYSINGYEPCVPMNVNGRMNPDYYRPKAVRVPLKLISPDL